MADEALGWVTSHLQEYGGSRRKALAVYAEGQVARLARGAQQSVKEFVEGKTQARKTLGDTGTGGRPPAQTTFEPSEENLKSGGTLDRAAQQLGVDLLKD